MPRKKGATRAVTQTRPTKRVSVRKSAGERSAALHKKLHGKFSVASKAPVTRENLDELYTPGVAEVSRRIAHDRDVARTYTSMGNMVAVVSDGSAVLGLGDVGPEAALPVMEGKAILFKELAGIDAVPLVLDTQSPEEIVRTVKALAPGFAGINLEDIKAPECFAVEQALTEALDIPVMHDDQHGTAIVVLAALLNAHVVVEKNLRRSRVAILGAGAAATAVTELLLAHGVGDIVLVDRDGILSELRLNLTPHKEALVAVTNEEGRVGGVREAVAGADVVIGLSAGGLLTAEHIRIMAQRPIVFGLANPEPEILPDEALAAGAEIVATGRSDFPNQVNNVLVFPGVFRGAIDHHVQTITTDMKLRAAEALAAVLKRPTAKKILPSVFDRRVVKAVASAIV